MDSGKNPGKRTGRNSMPDESALNELEDVLVKACANYDMQNIEQLYAQLLHLHFN